MTAGCTVELSELDLKMLTATLGERWVEDFVRDERSRRQALVHLGKAIVELSDLEFGMHLRFTRLIFHPGVTESLNLALSTVVPDAERRQEISSIVIDVLTDDAAIAAISESRLPGERRHQRRVDGRGCTCGWDGADMLRHLVGSRQREEIIELAAATYLSDEAVRYLQMLMRDPNWAASYWAARSRANDDIGLLFEALHRLGGEITVDDGEYRVRFPGAGDVARHSFAGTGFPLAIHSAAWNRPPGRYLQIWADASGLSTEDVATACELPVDVYQSVVSGSTCITPEIAHKLETGTNTYPANVWLMLERSYRAALVERANRPHH